MALQMSIQQDTPSTTAGGSSSTSAAPAPAPAAPGAPQFADPDFVMGLLGSLEGVDPNDPTIRATLEQVRREERMYVSVCAGC